MNSRNNYNRRNHLDSDIIKINRNNILLFDCFKKTIFYVSFGEEK